MFDFIAPAALAAIPGLLSICGWSRRACCRRPARYWPMRRHGLFEAQLHLPTQSQRVGKTLAQVRKMLDGELSMQAVLRDAGPLHRAAAGRRLRAGDQLVVRDTSERLMECAGARGNAVFRRYARRCGASADGAGSADRRAGSDARIAAAGSHTLNQANFDWHYQLVPLAIHRPARRYGGPTVRDLREMRLGCRRRAAGARAGGTDRCAEGPQ